MSYKHTVFIYINEDEGKTSYLDDLLSELQTDGKIVDFEIEPDRLEI